MTGFRNSVKKNPECIQTVRSRSFPKTCTILLGFLTDPVQLYNNCDMPKKNPIAPYWGGAPRVPPPKSRLHQDRQEFDRRLGEEIERLRSVMGWSQQDVASILGVSRSTVSQMEKGGRRISAFELALLSYSFQVDPMYLLGMVDETVLGWPPKPLP